ncbi:MAG: peptidylprolyl isomerase [Geobacteraceae bacterium]|nr:peptidylprolyl isomerase [Geobacteraceae bacterium]
MMKKLTAIFAALIISLPAALFAEQVSGIAALVNEEPITTYDVEKEKATLLKNMDGNAPLDAAAKEQLQKVALDSLVNKKLIEQKAKELNVKIADEEVRQAIEDVKKSNNITQDNLVAALAARGISFDEYKAQLKEQLERVRLIGMEVRSKIQISEKELRDYYSAHSDSFQVDEAYRARQIFFKLSPKATDEEKKRVTAKAVKVLQEAKKGADFAELARRNSEDQSAKEGGDLGFLKKGELLPEFENVLVKLKPGEVDGLITTAAGLHIIKLEEYRQGKQRTFDTAKPEIEDLLFKKKSEERFTQWLDDLRKGAAIEIR